MFSEGEKKPKLSMKFVSREEGNKMQQDHAKQRAENDGKGPVAIQIPVFPVLIGMALLGLYVRNRPEPVALPPPGGFAGQPEGFVPPPTVDPNFSTLPAEQQAEAILSSGEVPNQGAGQYNPAPGQPGAQTPYSSANYIPAACAGRVQPLAGESTLFWMEKLGEYM